MFVVVKLFLFFVFCCVLMDRGKTKHAKTGVFVFVVDAFLSDVNAYRNGYLCVLL